VVVGDCQQGLPFPDGYFHRILAIHVLEHLTNLPAALGEIRRVLKPGGAFLAVLPCEGGLLYGFCRRISAQRIFEKRYKQDYGWFIRSEHVNTAREILAEIEAFFRVSHGKYFPCYVPDLNFNVAIGLTLLRKDTD
jgi:ubiquinone/menaquinone biosynthesis C-methylase UbiE